MIHRLGVIVALAAMSLAGTTLAADLKPIPIAAFVRGAEYENPRLSPDGKHLAVRVVLRQEEGDLHLLTIYDLATMKAASTMRMQKYEMPGNIHWVSNTRLVVEIAKDLGWREAPVWTGELLATNVDGSNQKYLYGYQMFLRSTKGYSGRDDYGYGYVLALPAVRNGTFFMREVKWNDTSKRTFLYEMDANTAARKLVSEIEMPRLQFLMQHDNQVRYAFGTDEENDYVVKRLNDSGEWIDAPRKSPRELFGPVAFTADNKSVIATISSAGEPRALVEENMATGERRTLAKDKQADVNFYLWGARPRAPLAAGTRIGIPKLNYLQEDHPEVRLHRTLAAQFPGQYVGFSTFSDDANKLVFFVSSDKNPGDYYLLDRATGKADHLFAVRPAIDPDRMAERRPIEFKARTGTTLHGFLTLPKGLEAKQLPLVLMPHGGPVDVADRWFYDEDAQFLASRGYGVLQVNFRGSSGRGPKFRNSGFGQWGTGIQEDMIDGVKWAIDQGIVDPTRVCVFGASFGGYSAMMATIRAPGLFKCAIGFAGVYDLPMIFAEDSTRRYKGRYNYFRKALGEDKVDLLANSPAHHAEKINVPVFLAHGAQDETALPEQAEAMHAALNKSGKPHEWMMVPKEGHGFYAEKNRIAFYEKLEAFLAKHIGK